VTGGPRHRCRGTPTHRIPKSPSKRRMETAMPLSFTRGQGLTRRAHLAGCLRVAPRHAVVSRSATIWRPPIASDHPPWAAQCIAASARQAATRHSTSRRFSVQHPMKNESSTEFQNGGPYRFSKCAQQLGRVQSRFRKQFSALSRADRRDGPHDRPREGAFFVHRRL